jgi:hypothetical protein
LLSAAITSDPPAIQPPEGCELREFKACPRALRTETAQVEQNGVAGLDERLHSAPPGGIEAEHFGDTEPAFAIWCKIKPRKQTVLSHLAWKKQLMRPHPEEKCKFVRVDVEARQVRAADLQHRSGIAPARLHLIKQAVTAT